MPSRSLPASRSLALALAFALTPRAAVSQTRDSVPAVRLQARQWFQDAKFGVFMHWGVYSLLGQREWVMQNRSIQVPTYEWLASTFNAVRFDAHVLLSLVKASGAKYVTSTLRADRRHLVRRPVGQAGCRLATAGDLRADPSPPAAASPATREKRAGAHDKGASRIHADERRHAIDLAGLPDEIDRVLILTLGRRP